MKIKTVIIAIQLILPTLASAEGPCPTSTLCTTSTTTYGNLSYCTSGHSSTCYYLNGVNIPVQTNSCTKCSGTRKLETYKVTSPCTNVTYTDCICENGCTDTEWTAGNTGYEYSVTCGANCDTGRKYRCAKGYYGTSTNGTTGCTRCPSSGGTYGTTAAAGSTAITSCYIPSGTTFSDSTGSGTYTRNCYYTN
ncbi:MAG: hypothetical protein K2I81_01210 [Alphaproteobacteria bacterium]|nr:hypothetical protein [Alphaproteobacteria bacterium]